MADSIPKDGCYWVKKKNDKGTTVGNRWLPAFRITQNNGFVRWKVIYDNDDYNEYVISQYYEIGPYVEEPK